MTFPASSTGGYPGLLPQDAGEARNGTGMNMITSPGGSAKGGPDLLLQE